MGESSNNKKLQLSYLRPPLNRQSHPWLIFSHGKHTQRQTFYSISEGRYYVKVIPEMRNKLICCSCSGWLLLKDLDTNDYSFINPRSMEKIELPKTRLRIISCIPFGTPDRPKDLFLFICEKSICLIWSNPWKKFARSDNELEDEAEELMVAVDHEGVVYGLTHSGFMKLVRIEHKSPWPELYYQSSIIKESILQYIGNFNLPLKAFMVTSREQVIVVVQNYSHLSCTYGRVVDFQIFRADFKKKAWEEMNNIGNRTIFLSSHEAEYNKCCFVFEDEDEDEDESKSGIKTNSIYFSQSARLYIYDLKHRSISVSLPSPAVSRYYSFDSWVDF